MNRPASPGAGPPAVLVGGAQTDSLLAAPVHLALDARLVPGRSATIVGRWGEDDAPVVVTTPLTGWFACAGERGTGIAIALELAATLARDLPVVLVGTTGHELEHLGARSFLAGHPLSPRAVIHLGAGLAAADRTADGSLELGDLRLAFAGGGAGPGRRGPRSGPPPGVVHRDDGPVELARRG